MTNMGNQRRFGTYVRPVAYWLLWVFLVLEVSVNFAEIIDYFEEPYYYHRVYEYPAVHIAWGLFFGPLALVAIVYQLAGWRRRVFSPVAVALIVLQICCGIADSYFNFDGMCCG